MSTVTKFATGFALEEDRKVTYFVPNSVGGNDFLPLDLTVLEAETLPGKDSRRKFYEAYKTQVIEASLLKQWKTSDHDSVVNTFKKAINGSNEATVRVYRVNDENSFLEIRLKKGDGWEVVGSISLEKIELVPSVGKMLETVVINLMNTAQENKMVKNESENLRKKQEKLESQFRKLIHEKAKLEDRLIRAFTKVLNTKKQRIRELEAENRKLRKRHSVGDDHDGTSTPSKRMKHSTTGDRPFGASSSDSEAERLSNQEDTTDYEAETDVHDSDEDRPVVIPKDKCASSSKSKSKSLGKEDTLPVESKCKKNLFAETTKSVDGASSSKATVLKSKPVEILFDSESDSEEMVIPSEPLKAKRTEDSIRLPLQTPEKSREAEDDDDDTQFIPGAENLTSDTQEPKTVKQAADEEKNSNDEIFDGLFDSKTEEPEQVVEEKNNPNDDILGKFFDSQ